MKELKLSELDYEKFKPLGTYENMVNPEAEKISAGENVEFYRDMISLKLGQENSVSFSVCTVSKRKQVVDLVEYHSNTEESIMPLNGDIALLIAPATPGDMIPVDRFEIFRIPSGTMVVLKKGVWHSGPFVLGDRVISILVGLPERTYVNDSIVVILPVENQIRFSNI